MFQISSERATQFSILFSWGTVWAWSMLFKPKEAEYATELVREARRLSKMEKVAQVAQANQALERPSSYGLVPQGYYSEIGTAGALWVAWASRADLGPSQTLA